MDLLSFLTNLTHILQAFANISSLSEQEEHCDYILQIIQSYVREEKDFHNKEQALKKSLLFYAAIRPLCAIRNIKVDTLGHAIFIECARYVMENEFQQSEENVKEAFRDAVADCVVSLQSFMISHVFLVLQWLVLGAWNNPVLSAIMTGGEIEEETALNYIQSGEFPEILRIRIEILISQHCEDLALNLCSWCVRSPVFEEDVFVRKTYLFLLFKQGHDDFHEKCVSVRCCTLLKILEELKQDENTNTVVLPVCQTAFLQMWLHPEEESCCKYKEGDTRTHLKSLLQWYLKELHEQCQENSQQFLDSIHKVQQLALNEGQKRLLLEEIIDEFSDEYLQFCAELGLILLKKDRFALDASKIKRDETQAEESTENLKNTCKHMARLFCNDARMTLVCELTLFYLDPNVSLLDSIKERVQIPNSTMRDASATRSGPNEDVKPPMGLDIDVYKELLCVVDMLRPAEFQPRHGWAELKAVLVRHMLQSGFKFNSLTNEFIKMNHAIKDGNVLYSNESAKETLNENGHESAPSSACSSLESSQQSVDEINEPSAADEESTRSDTPPPSQDSSFSQVPCIADTSSEQLKSKTLNEHPSASNVSLERLRKQASLDTEHSDCASSGYMSESTCKPSDDEGPPDVRGMERTGQETSDRSQSKEETKQLGSDFLNESFEGAVYSTTMDTFISGSEGFEAGKKDSLPVLSLETLSTVLSDVSENEEQQGMNSEAQCIENEEPSRVYALCLEETQAQGSAMYEINPNSSNTEYCPKVDVSSDQTIAGNYNGQREPQVSNLPASTDGSLTDTLTGLSCQQATALVSNVRSLIDDLLSRPELTNLAGISRATLLQVLGKASDWKALSPLIVKLQKLLILEETLKKAQGATTPQQNSEPPAQQSNVKVDMDKIQPITDANEIMFDPALLSCSFCGKEYDTIVRRRRHEDFFCSKKPNSGVEINSPELLVRGQNGRVTSSSSQDSPKPTPPQVKVSSARVPLVKTPSRPDNQGTMMPVSANQKEANNCESLGNNFDLKIERLDLSTQCRHCQTYLLSLDAKKKHLETCEVKIKYQEKVEQARRAELEDYRSELYPGQVGRATPRRCRFCALLLPYISKLKRHEKLCAEEPPSEDYVEPDDGTLATCKYCHRIFDTHRNMHVHIVQCHPETYDEEPSNDETSAVNGQAEVFVGDNGTDCDVMVADSVEKTDAQPEVVNCEDNDSDVDIEVDDQEENEDTTVVFRVRHGDVAGWPCTNCCHVANSFLILLQHCSHIHRKCNTAFVFLCPLCKCNDFMHTESLYRHALMQHSVPRTAFPLSDAMVRMRVVDRHNAQALLTSTEAHTDYMSPQSVNYRSAIAQFQPQDEALRLKRMLYDCGDESTARSEVVQKVKSKNQQRPVFSQNKIPRGETGLHTVRSNSKQPPASRMGAINVNMPNSTVRTTSIQNNSHQASLLQHNQMRNYTISGNTVQTKSAPHSSVHLLPHRLPHKASPISQPTPMHRNRINMQLGPPAFPNVSMPCLINVHIDQSGTVKLVPANVLAPGVVVSQNGTLAITRGAGVHVTSNRGQSVAGSVLQRTIQPSSAQQVFVMTNGLAVTGASLTSAQPVQLVTAVSRLHSTLAVPRNTISSIVSNGNYNQHQLERPPKTSKPIASNSKVNIDRQHKLNSIRENPILSQLLFNKAQQAKQLQPKPRIATPRHRAMASSISNHTPRPGTLIDLTDCGVRQVSPGPAAQPLAASDRVKTIKQYFTNRPIQRQAIRVCHHPPRVEQMQTTQTQATPVIPSSNGSQAFFSTGVVYCQANATLQRSCTTVTRVINMEPFRIQQTQELATKVRSVDTQVLSALEAIQRGSTVQQQPATVSCTSRPQVTGSYVQRATECQTALSTARVVVDLTDLEPTSHTNTVATTNLDESSLPPTSITLALPNKHGLVDTKRRSIENSQPIVQSCVEHYINSNKTQPLNLLSPIKIKNVLNEAMEKSVDLTKANTTETCFTNKHSADKSNTSLIKTSKPDFHTTLDPQAAIDSTHESIYTTQNQTPLDTRDSEECSSMEESPTVLINRDGNIQSYSVETTPSVAQSHTEAYSKDQSSAETPSILNETSFPHAKTCIDSDDTAEKSLSKNEEAGDSLCEASVQSDTTKVENCVAVTEANNNTTHDSDIAVLVSDASECVQESEKVYTKDSHSNGNDQGHAVNVSLESSQGDSEHASAEDQNNVDSSLSPLCNVTNQIENNALKTGLPHTNNLGIDTLTAEVRNAVTQSDKASETNCVASRNNESGCDSDVKSNKNNEEALAKDNTGSKRVTLYSEEVLVFENGSIVIRNGTSNETEERRNTISTGERKIGSDNTKNTSVVKDVINTKTVKHDGNIRHYDFSASKVFPVSVAHVRSSNRVRFPVVRADFVTSKNTRRRAGEKHPMNWALQAGSPSKIQRLESEPVIIIDD